MGQVFADFVILIYKTIKGVYYGSYYTFRKTFNSA